jgi:DNA-binding transcriptional MerR regulator
LSAPVQKSERAYRTIGEAAEEVGVPAHVLRFWESKFHQIKPMKRTGGRRFYRPEDIALLHAIKTSLYTRGYTIKGVQKLLREQGVEALRAEGGPEPETFVQRMAAVANRLEDAKKKVDAALEKAER